LLIFLFSDIYIVLYKAVSFRIPIFIQELKFLLYLFKNQLHKAFVI